MEHLKYTQHNFFLSKRQQTKQTKMIQKVMKRNDTCNSLRKGKYFLLLIFCFSFFIYCVSFVLLSSNTHYNDLPFAIILSSLSITYEDNNNLKHDDNNMILPRVIAIVFPQYHVDPLNDKLWGPGFTDWNNLLSAPKYNRDGYKIPRPLSIEDGGLGYYDYTETEIRKRQGELAKQHNIDGFMYHHYWFYDPAHPGPTLAQPLINMLSDGYPDMPFFFHWCADPWTKTWQGANTANGNLNETLQEQFYPSIDSIEVRVHYDWLQRFFKHHNYIKVGGRPVLMLWKSHDGLFRIVEQFNKWCIEDGYEPLYVMVGEYKPHDDLVLNKYNDNKTWLVETERPADINEQQIKSIDRIVPYPYTISEMVNRSFRLPYWCEAMYNNNNNNNNNNNQLLNNANTLFHEVPSVLTSFDNTPRRTFESAHLWNSDLPSKVLQRFYTSLYTSIFYESCCIPKSSSSSNDDRFILINAMNEWAEAMSLEPSDVYGFTFLQAVHDAKHVINASQCNIPISDLKHHEEYNIN